MTTTTTIEQVYRVFIKATPQRIWDAITQPELTAQYFHGARITVTADHYDSRSPDGETWGDAEVEVFDPPRRLVHGWRSMYDPTMAAEAESRVTWEIEDQGNGTCLLTVVHDRLDHSPVTARNVSGAGWMGVLSGLKTFLETGEPMVAR
jgi:uncharacterized protein YndB with AHSA1/START domain